MKKLVVRGLPESISQLSTPVTTLCMNLVLRDTLGDMGINAYSLISYVASFTVAVFLGAGEGLQPLFGQSCGARDEQGLKTYFRAGMSINLIGSVLINILLLFVGGHVCALFGADADTLAFTVRTMPMYACGFIAMAPNVMISAYLYSTKRSKQAIIINILRSLAANSILILLLPKIFGSGIIWFTFCIYEIVVLIVAVILLKHSEKDGVIR